MTPRRAKSPPAAGSRRAASAATVGFEAQLWAAADALRNNMDAAEYKHVVLGLIFRKYISDAFEAKHAALAAQQAQGADPEDRDEYRAASIFWVPPTGSALYAGVLRLTHHLAPAGLAGLILARDSVTSNHSSEGEFRKAAIEAGLVACIDTLTDQFCDTLGVTIYAEAGARVQFSICRMQDRQLHRLRTQREDLLDSTSKTHSRRVDVKID